MKPMGPMRQFCWCLQSSETMKRPIQIMQGKKLVANRCFFFVAILTTSRANTVQLGGNLLTGEACQNLVPQQFSRPLLLLLLFHFCAFLFGVFCGFSSASERASNVTSHLKGIFSRSSLQRRFVEFDFNKNIFYHLIEQTLRVS